MKNILYLRFRDFGVLSLILLSFSFTGCGTTMKVLSSDEKTSEEITSSSNNRIALIMLNDSTSEFGSHIMINHSTTEWKTASVVRRQFDEINVFHATDSWKFIEGSALHTAIPTNMIKSITIPADRLGVGIVIGSLIGAGLGVGLSALVSSASTSPFYSSPSSNFNTLLIFDVVLLALAGGALGGQIGASHQTTYTW